MRKLLISTILILSACAVTFAQADNPSPCSEIELDGSPINSAGETITFTATVHTGNTNSLVYNWTISAGTVIEGQGTPTIKVATNSEVGETNVIAAVEIKGLPVTCKNTFTDQIQIPTSCRFARIIDNYENLPFKEEKARLDNAAFQLKEESDFSIVFVISLGEKDTYSSVKTRIANIKKHLREVHSIPSEKIIFVFGEADIKNTQIYFSSPDSIKMYLELGKSRLEEIRPSRSKF